MIMCASRHLQNSKKNYAPIEGGALAIAGCLKKSCNFLLGAEKFMFLTDHKPLINIFNDKSLSSVDNPRQLNRSKKLYHTIS